MTTIFYILCLGFILSDLAWIRRIIIVRNWIRRTRDLCIANDSQATTIYIIIPILDEVGRIEETVDYFLGTFQSLSKLRLVLVTTQKEFARNRSSSHRNTVNVVRQIAEKERRVIAFHYPLAKGGMAHQVNFALQSLLARGIEGNALFAFYNADSRPHPKTFSWVINKKSAYPRFDVFQQYGNYTQNVHGFRGVFARSILVAAALWQTRWSLGFEIAHVLQQPFDTRQKNTQPRWKYPLNYCIGHGLIFTPEVYRRLQGFSESTYTEDAIFGLELSYDRVPIIPIPYFDGSDTPDTLRGLILQQANWFLGLFTAWRYPRIITQKRHPAHLDRLALNFLTAKLFVHSLYWILGPAFFLVMIFEVMLLWTPLAATLLVAVWLLYIAIPSVLALHIIREYEPLPRDLFRKTFLLFHAVSSLLFYLLHGFAASFSLLRLVWVEVMRKDFEKQKTPMRHQSMGVLEQTRKRVAFCGEQREAAWKVINKG